MSLQSRAIADIEALELGLLGAAATRIKRGYAVAVSGKKPISGAKLKVRRDSARISAHAIETKKRVALAEHTKLRGKRATQAMNLRLKASPLGRQVRKVGLRAVDQINKHANKIEPAVTAFGKVAARAAYKHPLAATAAVGVGAAGAALGGATLAKRVFKRSKNGEFAMSLQNRAIANIEALELAHQGSRGNPIIAYPHEHVKIPGVATKWERTPNKGIKAIKDIARAGAGAIARTAHNNRGAIAGAATGAIVSRLAAGQMLPSRIVGGAVVGHLLHRRAKKRKAKAKHGTALSFQDRAIADIEDLELGLFDNDVAKRAGHIGKMIGHGALASTGLPHLRGVALGGIRGAASGIKGVKTNVKGALSRGKTVGQRAGHLAKAGLHAAATPLHIVGRAALGAPKAAINTTLAQLHHLGKAIASKEHLHSGSKRMMLNY